MVKENFSFKGVEHIKFDPNRIFAVLQNIHSLSAKKDLKKEIDCGIEIPRRVVRVEKKQWPNHHSEEIAFEALSFDGNIILSGRSLLPA